MELVERYIYAVTRKLPQHDRAEVRLELEKLIDEKLKDSGQDEKKIEEVLEQLGSPTKMAEKYRKSKRSFIISADYFDTYIIVIKVVMVALFIFLTAVHMIPIFIEPVSILSQLFNYISSLINISIQAFVLITVIFFVLDYKQIKIKGENNRSDEHWTIKDLPPIPTSKNQIKKSEAIIGIVFSIVFMIILLFYSHLIGIPVISELESVTFISFINRDAVIDLLPLLILFISLGIVKEVLKLVNGKWTNKLAIQTLLINALSISLVAVVIMSPSFWNPNFISELTQSGLIDPQSEAFSIIDNIWPQISTLFIVFLSVGYVIDSITGFYKANRYGA